MNLPELSYVIDIEKITISQATYVIEANQKERHLIATRLNIASLNSLKAELVVQKKSSSTLCVEGKVEAQVTQYSSHTLETLDQDVMFSVKELFLIVSEEKQGDIDISLEEEAEPLSESILDLGELVIQCLSLQLQPYPKGDQSHYLDYIEDQATQSPFQKLKDDLNLKKSKK